MSGCKPITSYFKVRSKDELEVEELLLSQVSRHSRASSLQRALTISTVSSQVMSMVVDLSKDDSVSAGDFLKEALAVYDSTDDEVDAVLDPTVLEAFTKIA